MIKSFDPDLKYWFRGGNVLPLEIIRNDLTKVEVDVIVNPTDPFLSGSGGVDREIHMAAGSELVKECEALGGLEFGQAKITKGYMLPAKHIIHTAGPIWKDGKSGEEEILANCYRNSLALAKEHSLESVAIPLISSGSFGYPKDKALKTAISEIGSFLLENDMTVYLVVYDKKAFSLSAKLFSSIKQYIDDKYVDSRIIHTTKTNDIYYQLKRTTIESADSSIYEEPKPKRKRKLDDLVSNLDDTFSQMLIRLIDERGMKDTNVYKRANIDRRLFSRIKNDKDYTPSKSTVLAFAIALELNLDETKDLLKSAGYSLSRSRIFDIIIEYFILEENYDIFEINGVLFEFEQKTLGV